MNRTMPSCTVMPVLVYADVDEASDWLCDAFGFVERWRAGGHRAQLVVGDGAIVLSEGSVGGACGAHSTMVRVDDVDAHYEVACARGAKILSPPADYPYGERQYAAEDPAGHRWTFSQSIADVSPEEWGGESSDAMDI